jgi:hypothetical protein
MANNIRRWFYHNGVQITWFIIGLLVAFGIENLSEGHYVAAVVNFAFAYLNYILGSR